MFRLVSLGGVLLLLAVAPSVAEAQPLVYQPRNPAFGGSPLNFQPLLSAAQAQNDFEAEGAVDRFFRDPLQDFEQSLQRQILSQLSREIIGDRFGGLDLSEEGRFDFGDFTVDIIPGLNEVTIRIFNVLTGDESVISIPSLP
ncbi:MAG TPA: curli assembly protein CsgF [Rubricoccaceae bacterium]|nr:curli assembly protein CsgF [Rubricoccaceae bacterium]